MNHVFDSFVQQARFGDIETHGPVSVLPIFMPHVPVLDYVSLESALRSDAVEIVETDEVGSVPELHLVNSSDLNVLILDGEELEGAKQNRVLNTTVIAGSKRKITIPVSCTESGRWSFTSQKFRSSQTIMPRDIRETKKRSVDESLRSSRSFRSDQVRIWSDVQRLLERTNTDFSTNAMKDAIDGRRDLIDGYSTRFTFQPGQTGMVVFVEGLPSGIEYCSRPEVFQEVMPRLITSYAFEAIIDVDVNDRPEVMVGLDEGQTFLDSIKALDIETYQSVGLGTDIRFRDSNVSGSAVIHVPEVIQLSAYAIA